VAALRLATFRNLPEIVLMRLRLAFAAAVAATACHAADIKVMPYPKLNPGYHTPPEFDVRNVPRQDAVMRGFAAGSLQTLPSWSKTYAIDGKTYSYTLLGTDPNNGAATTSIPTVLVPLRLTVPDTIVNGQALVLDASTQIKDIENSPIFTASKYDSGNLQFADAMLHAEFPHAPRQWHLLFEPSVAPTIDVTAPAGAVQVYQSKSGKYLGVINNANFLNGVFNRVLNTSSPQSYVVFITYNALLSGAFGFHSDAVIDHGKAAVVFAYNSWLRGVDDLFSTPSPDADTFAHEIAETVHDALGLSLTREWGDWFNNNKCFQNYIEVGDAVEDAPASVQNYHQKVLVNGKEVTYTLQTEAMLPWFEREYPSSAIHQAYSFPGETALLGPAPLNCAK
jgi:hypothetical protein